MAAATNYFDLGIGNHLLRTAQFTKPAELWLALFKIKPDADGAGGSEVFADGYSRIACGPGNAFWSAPTDGTGEFKNIVELEFGGPNEDWAVAPEYIVAYGIYDAQVGGNLLITNDLLTPQEVLDGGLPPKFEVGQLIIAFR